METYFFHIIFFSATKMSSSNIQPSQYCKYQTKVISLVQERFKVTHFSIIPPYEVLIESIHNFCLTLSGPDLI